MNALKIFHVIQAMHIFILGVQCSVRHVYRNELRFNNYETIGAEVVQNIKVQEVGNVLNILRWPQFFSASVEKDISNFFLFELHWEVHKSYKTKQSELVFLLASSTLCKNILDFRNWLWNRFGHDVEDN